MSACKDTRNKQGKKGIIKGYAVNTYHGLKKNTNEDRVTIVTNMKSPKNMPNWPKCHFFGVFDGHGGEECADFLKENLHKYVINQSSFPTDPVSALKSAF